MPPSETGFTIPMCAKCATPDERVRGCKYGFTLAGCTRCSKLTSGRLDVSRETWEKARMEVGR